MNLRVVVEYAWPEFSLQIVALLERHDAILFSAQLILNRLGSLGHRQNVVLPFVYSYVGYRQISWFLFAYDHED